MSSKTFPPALSSSSFGSHLLPVKDSASAVYSIFLLHGVGMLMSWNMFITIAPQYYVDYWFTVDGNATNYAQSLMSIIGVTSQIPNVGIMFVNMASVAALSLMVRVSVPLIFNSCLVILIIILAIFVQPNDDDRNWFYIVTLIIIISMNLCNGVYQNSIYGIVADFPENYPNSLIIGNNLCGIFTSGMSIFTTILSPGNAKLNAALYFCISLAILVICGLSLILLVRLPYYRYVMAIGQRARQDGDAENPNLKQYVECFSYCWVQLFNNFFVYFVSLIIFPAMMSETPYYRQPGDPWNSVFPENLYFAINTFLNFNVFASLGSFTANYIHFPKPRFLWIPVVARLLFVPFFMFCNYQPVGKQRTIKVIFKNEWWFTIGGSFMAYTCGYFGSLALIYTPIVVPASYQKISGMAAAIALMLGVSCVEKLEYVSIIITTAQTLNIFFFYWWNLYVFKSCVLQCVRICVSTGVQEKKKPCKKKGIKACLKRTAATTKFNVLSYTKRILCGVSFTPIIATVVECL